MPLNAGVIQVRGQAADLPRIEKVIREHWAGAREVALAGRKLEALGLQSGRTDCLGFAISSPEGGWITVVDSESFTADPALAEHIAQELATPVVWYTLTGSANAASLRMYGPPAGLGEPGDDEDFREMRAWAEAQFARAAPTWSEDTADWSKVVFEGVDRDLYVDDPTWLEAGAIAAGAIQVRVKTGIDPEKVLAEVVKYWEQCGAVHDDAVAVPESACGVITESASELVVAVSPVQSGWITVIDSEREVADLGLADWLAAELDADVAWYWVDSESDTGVIRLFGFDEISEEPADEPASVIGYAQDAFPLPFAPIDLVDGTWLKAGFREVDPDQYVTDPDWLDEAIASAE